MRWRTASLKELSGGSAKRAAGILVLAHLIPAPVMLGIWAIGLHPVFDDARWIPSWIALAVGMVVLVWLFGRFGMWGTPASGNKDHGEEYMDTFGTGVGFGLGWLRWFMQIVAVALALVPGLMTWTDVRAWHFVGTDELRTLPDRAAAIPVPHDWVLVESEETSFGLSQLVSWPDGNVPNGSIERRYEVPSTYTFEDLEQWVKGPGWTERADGDAFGAIEIEICNSESTFCHARLAPPGGEQPEYFVLAELHEGSDFADPEVEIDFVYRKYVEPDWNVSRETVDRAMSIPIPPDWVRHSDVNAERDNSGEGFVQRFGVPESTTREDLEAWITGSQWTAPATGEAFGEVELDKCREVGPGELDRSYLCSVLVVRSDDSARPVESMNISLDADHQVRVSLSRNG